MPPDDSKWTAAPTRAEGILLVTAAFAWIVLLYAAFHPLWQGDSGGYTAPGCMMWGPYSLRAYDGARTPLYPLFLSFLQHVSTGGCSPDPAPQVLELITGVQLLLYLGAFLFCYRALAGFGRLVRLLGMAAIALSPLHALFARQILTESLAASLLLVLVAHLVRFTLRGRSDRDATAVFVLVALLALTRPNVLWPLLPVLALVTWLGRHRRRLVARAVLVTGVPLLGLMTFNQWNQRHFRLTNIDGYAKTQIVYNAFERVHPEDAVLGEIMSRQCRHDMAVGEADGQVIWRAVDEIRKSIDRMPYRKRRSASAGTSDLNAYLDRVSTYLALENPGVVLDNTRRTFARLWDLGIQGIPAVGVDPRSPGHDRNIANDSLYAAFLRAQPLQNAIVRGALLLLPLLLVAGALRRGAARVVLPALLYAVYVANMVMVAMFNVVQVRYVTLMQPLLVLAVCLALEAVLERAASTVPRSDETAPPAVA